MPTTSSTKLRRAKDYKIALSATLHASAENAVAKALDKSPDLTQKKQPAQLRAQQTVQAILQAAAQVLAEVGIERLSTNLICEQAKLTPPALYRYFPNKYAVLSALGQQLMQAQNSVVAKWITREALEGHSDQLQAALQSLTLETWQLTRDTMGGVWLMRAMRAVPALESVRLESHQHITNASAVLLDGLFPGHDPYEVRLAFRLVVDFVYTTIEMLFDNPDLNAEDVARVMSNMIVSHIKVLRHNASSKQPSATHTTPRT